MDNENRIDPIDNGKSLDGEEVAINEEISPSDENSEEEEVLENSDDKALTEDNIADEPIELNPEDMPKNKRASANELLRSV